MTEFVKQCLHCMNSKAGEKIPQSLGETVHGRRPREVLHFDYLYAGDSGPLSKDGLDKGDRFKYILVISVVTTPMENHVSMVLPLLSMDYGS